MARSRQDDIDLSHSCSCEWFFMRPGYVPGRKQRSSMAAEMWFSKDEVFAHIQTLLVGFFDQGDNKEAMFEGMGRRNLKIWNKIIKRDVEAKTMFEGMGRRKRNLKIWNKIIKRDVEAKTMFEGMRRSRRNLKIWNKIIKRDVEAKTIFEGDKSQDSVFA